MTKRVVASRRSKEASAELVDRVSRLRGTFRYRGIAQFRYEAGHPNRGGSFSIGTGESESQYFCEDEDSNSSLAQRPTNWSREVVESGRLGFPTCSGHSATALETRRSSATR